MAEPILSCPDPQRWIARITKAAAEDDAGCWVWQRRLDRYGYGGFGFIEDGRSRGTGAHRAAWLAFRGDIPEAYLHVDHLCRNRACVNPWHMELVTNQVNTQRGFDARPTLEERVRIRVKQRVRPGCKKHGRQEGRASVDERGHHFKCYICGRERNAAARAARTTTKEPA